MNLEIIKNIIIPISNTIAAVVAAIVIAYKQNKLSKQIADNQNCQTERQIKISLYEKRLEIYECFIRYWNKRNLLLEEKFDIIPSLNNLDILVKDVFSPLENYDYSDAFSSIILINREISRISFSTLLFDDKNIAVYINDYVTKILKFALSIKANCWKKEDLRELQEIVISMEKNKILEKLEKELCLS